MRLWKQVISAGLSLALLAGTLPAGLAEQTAASDFKTALEARYVAPSIEDRTEVRWWMAEGAHTDETLLEEVQAMYDAGFRGLELCEQNDGVVAETDYGYGSDQWDHDMRLVMNKALDLGMTVSMTSGTNWSTANIPGLDPDSQAASQVIFELDETLAAGESRTGALPTEKTVTAMSWGQEVTNTYVVRDAATFVGAFAYKQVSDPEAAPVVFDPAVNIDLTDSIVKGADGAMTLDWTAPDDGTYRIFYYWQQGAYQTSSPAIEPSYCINYFDEAGVEALKAYWMEHILNDEALNAKIKEGDVQLFMDSLEINVEDGVTFWSQDMQEQFQARKGYDIRPYLYLFIDLPEMWFFEHAGYGAYDMADAELRTRIQNDMYDVQTQLYMERMLTPIKEWMNSYGIETRAQISYGQRLEISEPIQNVDYPEAENLNQDNQPDIYRLWTGGAKLQNKVLSSETGAVGGYQYGYTFQKHLEEVYDLFASGFSRIIWHVWSSQYGPGDATAWPGYTVSGFMGMLFYTFGTREPSAVDYADFNDHLGRIQALLREGVSRTDVGMVYLNYDQGMPTSGNSGGINWLLNHDEPLFPSTELQDNGFTYDYFAPSFLTADGVSYDAANGTMEQAGYKSLVVWQKWLTVEAAQQLLELAKQGMKLVVVDGAAVQTPYNDGRDAELADVMAELRKEPAVASAATNEDVYEALLGLGVTPYAGFTAANQQLLTQVREDGDNAYLFAYNYCDGTYQSFWSNGAVQDTHGETITTEIVMDGLYIPYQIDAWTGEATALGSYRQEDGKTIFPITLDYGSIALYAFEGRQEAPLHAVESDAEVLVKDGKLTARTTVSGAHTATLSDGSVVSFDAQVPAPSDITGWNVTVESWTPGTDRESRTETLNDKTITETAVVTVKTPITVSLDKLTTWDNIPEIGKEVSGQGVYTATFAWDGTATGAKLDFGTLVESMDVMVNGQAAGCVSMTDAILDITPYLVAGDNTIELHYSSNLTNVVLANGLKNEGPINGWYGYEMAYHSYGPAQAVLVPYVDTVLAE